MIPSNCHPCDQKGVCQKQFYRSPPTPEQHPNPQFHGIIRMGMYTWTVRLWTLLWSHTWSYDCFCFPLQSPSFHHTSILTLFYFPATSCLPSILTPHTNPLNLTKYTNLHPYQLLVSISSLFFVFSISQDKDYFFLCVWKVPYNVCCCNTKWLQN